MKLGDTGPQVVDLQNKLRAAGFQVEATGTYDQPTLGAVLALQGRYGLVPDGVVGPKTLALLGFRRSLLNPWTIGLTLALAGIGIFLYFKFRRNPEDGTDD